MFTQTSDVSFDKTDSLTLFNLNQTSRRLKSAISLSNRTGIAYQLSKKQNIDFVFDWLSTSLFRTSSTKSDYGRNKIIDSTNQTTILNDETSKLKNFILNYQLKGDTIVNQNLSIALATLYYRSDKSGLNETNTISSIPYTPVDLFNNTLAQNISNFSARVDYSQLVLNKIQFQSGIRLSTISSVNNAIFYAWVNGNFEIDPSRSFRFNYDEKNFSLYSTLEGQIGNRFNYQIGARLEQINSSGGNETNPGLIKRRFANVFPALFFTYTFKNTNTLSYAATSRIIRPSFEDLNPFKYYINNTIYIQGDPGILPTILLRNELSYTTKKLITQISFVQRKRIISTEPIATQDSVSFFNKKGNYSNSLEYALDLIYSKSFTKWWTINFSGTASIISFKGNISNFTFDQRAFRSSIEINNRLTISDKSKIYANIDFANYFPRFSNITKISNQYQLDFGLQKKYKNLSFGVSVLDLFRTSKDRYLTRYGDSFRIKETGYYDLRSILFYFNLTIGKQLDKDYNNDAGNEEERRRIR